MGLFSGKTIISVASSVYNLAGDEKDRPIYLKNLIVSNVLSGTKKTLGEGLNSGYLGGPGIKLRSFFRWAQNNYGAIGMPTGALYANDSVNTDTVAAQIPKASNEVIWVQQASIGDSDYDMWAEQWILRNYPDQLQLEWEADFTDDTKTVHISLPNGVTTSFVASDFVNGSRYVFAYYTRSKLGTSDPVVEGSWVDLDPVDSFPSVTGYTLASDDRSTETASLNWATTTVVTYSDGRPDESSFLSGSVSEDYLSGNMIYDKTTFLGNDTVTDAKISNKSILTLKYNKVVLTDVNTETIEEIIEEEDKFGDPVFITKTTTILSTEEYLENDNSYREDNQKLYDQIWMPIDLFIYRIGSGNTVLDDLVNETGNYGQFFPMIPVRLNNKFLNQIPGYEDELALAKKAFKKATDGGKYTDIVDQIAENEDVGDMDYVYATFGVPLNAIDKSARKYMYEFFTKLMLDQSGNSSSGVNFEAEMAAYRAAYSAWVVWRNNNAASPSSTPAPVVPPKPTLPYNEIRIATTNINYDIRLSWHFIYQVDNTGLGKTGAKKGDIWLQYLNTKTIVDPTYTGSGSGATSDNVIKYETIRIYWQYEDNKFKYLDIAGLVHRNFIYSGKNVRITAKEALEDGDESGFLVPLHYATFRSMSLVDSTQLSTTCMFLVFNVYQVKKQKWWQTGFFKILFAIVIAIVSVAFTGGAGLGLLGSNLAIGASLGFTGVTAAIVGSIANALAALVLSTIISRVTENMGTFGAILGAVIGVVISGAMMNFQAGSGFNFNFADLMKADNILKLVDAAGKGYQAYVRSGITGMQNELSKLQEDANAELNRIRNEYFEQFGYGGGQIDPMMFVDNSPVLAESRDTFLARTLMSGSDVAAMSHNLLNDYVELTLTLPNAFT